MARQRKLSPERKAFINSLIEHYRKRLILGCTPEMYSGYQARNLERKRFTLFYTTQLLHTFIPRS